MSSSNLIHNRWPLLGTFLEMAGARTAADRPTAQAVLSALIDSSLEPTRADTDERATRAFDHSWVLDTARGETTSSLFLHRDQAPRYTAIWNRSTRPSIRFRFEPSPTSSVAVIVGMADLLARAYTPDFGTLFCMADLDPTPGSSDEAQKALLDESAGLPTFYPLEGVGGLGYRSFVGPLIAKQLGEERLVTLAAPTTASLLDWGGWRIDLCPEPWSAPWETVRDAYRASMAHLRPSGWFATPHWTPSGQLEFLTPSHAGWTAGGVAPPP